MDKEMDKEKIELEVNNLTFSYKTGRKTLSDVSIKVFKKQIVGLVGESGSGKSTVAKCITGLLLPDSGEISKHETRMIFQDSFSSLNPAKTVGFHFEEVLRLKKVPAEERKDTIKKMLNLIELEEDLLSHLPAQLSGGQRQRVGIGMALLSEPSLIIADEPVSALDVTVQAQILKLLKKLRDEKEVSFIFISHDLRTVYNLCDYVYVMKDGKIVEHGSIEDVYFNPQSDYTKQLLSAALDD